MVHPTETLIKVGVSVIQLLAGLLLLLLYGWCYKLSTWIKHPALLLQGYVDLNSIR